MDEYLCRTAFLYCGGRNGTFDKPFGHTYSMFLSKSFYEFNIFLTSVNLAL